MKEKYKPKGQLDLFRAELKLIINLEHELCLLADKINWKKFEIEFAGYFPANVGKPALPSRLILGVLYLKYVYGLSDEEVVIRWTENPYWQYFCGLEYFQHELPFHPTSLIKWRNRLGEAGCEKILKEIIEVGIKTETIEEKDLQKVVVDTTVQEKAITYPTDAKLQHRARVLLIKQAKKCKLGLRQTYLRLGKKALFMGHRYAVAKQMKRARKQFKLVKRYLGCVYRDILRQLANQPKLQKRFDELLQKTERLLTQKKDDKNKLYSLHAPEVECIGKGKTHKKYEFGVKTSIVITHKSNFVVGVKALPGNPYDGHTLKEALDQVEKLTGTRPDNGYVDLGYRKHDETQTTIHIARTKAAQRTYALRKDMRRRNAVEPVIGHLKSDGHLGRNYLKGRVGDKINALFSGIGHNLRLILRKLRLFWLCILWVLYVYFDKNKSNFRIAPE
jgi:transposase, IS5 family